MIGTTTSNGAKADAMTQDALNDVFQHDPNIIARAIAGELILVPIRKQVGEMESIYTLNETGARIWEWIDGRRTLNDLLELVLAEFEVEPLQAEADLLELFQALDQRHAVVKV